jgi:hypothetical protein
MPESPFLSASVKAAALEEREKLCAACEEEAKLLQESILWLRMTGRLNKCASADRSI